MTGILLVHGAWQRPVLDGVAERLRRRGHRVEAVRLRGHDWPPGRIWHRVHHYVEDVEVAAARFAEPPGAVGHSLGGLVVQRYLERGPAQGACCWPRSRRAARSLRLAGSPSVIR